jgi:hypothetical protein
VVIPAEVRSRASVGDMLARPGSGAADAVIRPGYVTASAVGAVTYSLGLWSGLAGGVRAGLRLCFSWRRRDVVAAGTTVPAGGVVVPADGYVFASAGGAET